MGEPVGYSESFSANAATIGGGRRRKTGRNAKNARKSNRNAKNSRKTYKKQGKRGGRR